MIPPNPNMADGALVAQERGCGQRLRNAREAAGLSVADVATRLKMPVRIIEALEAEDWARIGAPVFVRGQLRSYSRMLGLPIEPVQSASGVAPIEPTHLVAHWRTPLLQRVADQVGGRLVYIVITALIVLPVWVATRSHLDSSEELAAPLDVPADKLAAAQQTDTAAQPAVREPSTVVASMVPPRQSAPAPATTSTAPELSLHVNDDSWVQIRGKDGSTIEEALLKSGETRTYPAANVDRVVLGNAKAVEVQRNGQAQDLTPFMRASVARFTVSPDGSLAPVSD
ncbi:helix-turn-helix domain-containing protein [Luteimonas panaciterrae]|uniref:helix-turn-helix domain-containing protein n=1 Tax=Luteimonas panaciterrae TaxID=363885 RepID=UPI001CFC38B0|nr:RodZ domain-containing protein [Luteimonas panaciterrae]